MKTKVTIGNPELFLVFSTPSDNVNISLEESITEHALSPTLAASASPTISQNSIVDIPSKIFGNQSNV